MVMHVQSVRGYGKRWQRPMQQWPLVLPWEPLLVLSLQQQPREQQQQQQQRPQGRGQGPGRLQRQQQGRQHLPTVLLLPQQQQRLQLLQPRAVHLSVAAYCGKCGWQTWM